MNFCTRCGSRLEAQLKFCTQCGAPIPGATPPEATEIASQPESVEPFRQAQAAPSEPPPASEWQAVSVAPVQRTVPDTNRGCLRTVVVALCMVALFAALGIGGVVYLGYKMKQKAAAILHKAQDEVTTPNLEPDIGRDANSKPPGSSSPDGPAGMLGDLAKILGVGKGNASGGIDEGDPVPSVSERDPVEPCTAAPFPPQNAARIPLQEGTVITTAWGVKYEDVESRISLAPVTPVSISMSNSTGAYKLDSGGEARPSNYTDTVCNADLASAATYVTVVGTHIPHLIHGVTRLRLSDNSFKEVKSSGKTKFEYLDFMHAGNDAERPSRDAGLLTRVEPQEVPYPMIVNDERVTLPAIHLAGVTDSTGKDPRPKKWRPNHAAADLYVLDDPLDPLVLLWKEKDPALHDGRFRIEVVKIDFKTSRPVNIVEKQLTEQKRAVTYGIYFDFNKDTIKPESEPVLKQIVQAMTDNPTWNLTVEGHTDNIGGDSYNLELSKRRAAAVKQALVTRYRISPDRLSTDGFGASRPVEPNDTLEGRARNRRVELARE
jgi:outer membrane protein OmpA-like peptidoglycan-associated protein